MTAPADSTARNRRVYIHMNLRSVSGYLLDDLAGGLLGPDLLHGVLVAQVHPALLVDLGDLDPHHVAHLAGVLHLLDALVGQLGDMHQAVLAGCQLHEGDRKSVV